MSWRLLSSLTDTQLPPAEPQAGLLGGAAQPAGTPSPGLVEGERGKAEVLHTFWQRASCPACIRGGCSALAWPRADPALPIRWPQEGLSLSGVRDSLQPVLLPWQERQLAWLSQQYSGVAAPDPVALAFLQHALQVRRPSHLVCTACMCGGQFYPGSLTLAQAVSAGLQSAPWDVQHNPSCPSRPPVPSSCRDGAHSVVAALAACPPALPMATCFLQLP